MGGYVKIYRDLYEHPIVHKDNDYLSVWIYLLLNASHSETDTEFNGKIITLKKGQLVRGRLQISEKAKVEQSKVERILKRFIFEQMIEQQTCTKNRLITILNWGKYQISEQQNEQEFEQQMNNKRTTNEQQMNTYNNEKNIKNIKNDKNNTLKIKDTVRFVKPNLDEIRLYIQDDNLNVDASTFFDYYESNGWIVGKNKMKDWKATLRNWDRKNTQTKPKSSSGSRALDMLREMERQNESK